MVVRRNKAMRYRKKPVVVEAMRYHHDDASLSALFEFIPESFVQVSQNSIQVKTLEGWMDASPGDYIIKGLKGEYYPCKPDAFDETYDLAEE
ncbi:MAG: hypothetical protein WD645_02560 [Dehalococcoidia bacterium]